MKELVEALLKKIASTSRKDQAIRTSKEYLDLVEYFKNETRTPEYLLPCMVWCGKQECNVACQTFRKDEK